MSDPEDFTELEIETVAASLYADEECGEHHYLDEYGDYQAPVHYHRNNGCGGCLVLISTGLIFTAAALTLIVLF